MSFSSGALDPFGKLRGCTGLSKSGALVPFRRALEVLLTNGDGRVGRVEGVSFETVGLVIGPHMEPVTESVVLRVGRGRSGRPVEQQERETFTTILVVIWETVSKTSGW